MGRALAKIKKPRLYPLQESAPYGADSSQGQFQCKYVIIWIGCQFSTFHFFDFSQDKLRDNFIVYGQ